MDPIDEFNARKQGEQMAKVFDYFKDEVENDFRGRKLEKSIPVKPEWEKKFMELHKMAAQASEIVRKMKSKRNLLWGIINEELNDYRDMHFNAETKEIEIYADKQHKGALIPNEGFID